LTNIGKYRIINLNILGAVGKNGSFAFAEGGPCVVGAIANLMFA
jgi:hypothetical protein